MTVQVALKEGYAVHAFTFSKSYTVPRVVIHFSTGPTGLLHVTYMVANADLAGEDFLIGRNILQHLEIYSNSLLEQNRNQLDGTSC